MPLDKLNRKGRLINALSRYRTWYDKGISVLAILRNMELSDLGILMAVTKYLFEDTLSTQAIVLLGFGYWVFNVLVNLSVGWFWERNDGWRIEAEVFGKRTHTTRTILVSPEGHPYDARNVTWGMSGAPLKVSSEWPGEQVEERHGHE